MTHSFRSHFFHIIWATKFRTPWLSIKIEEQLYPFISGVSKTYNANLLAIGGIEDHIHLLIESKCIDNYTKLICAIKARSSGWLKKTFPECRNFAWQEGYASFSVSYLGINTVKKYIQNQKQHHKKTNFDSEYQRLLKKNNLKFDKRFVLG